MDTPHPMVSFSWDDGHPLDIRVAQLMADFELRGTFYIPSGSGKDRTATSRLFELRAMGMEIGSHGVTHSVLPRNISASYEIAESKDQLEQILAEPVLAFCYPLGKYDTTVAHLVKGAGYRLGRTTIAFDIGGKLDCFRMPVTLHFYPHSPITHIKHAAAGWNVRGIIDWSFRYGMDSDPLSLSKRLFDQARARTGRFHLWGHSADIEQFGLWGQLAELFAYIRGNGPIYAVTNLGLLAEAKS